MSKAFNTRLDNVEWTDECYFIQTISRTAYDTSGAVTHLGGFVAPGPLELIRAHIYRTGTLTADATIDLGTNSDDDAVIAAMPVNGTAGWAQLDLTDSTVVELSVNQGDYVFATLNADADATGGSQIVMTFVWGPQSSYG